MSSLGKETFKPYCKLCGDVYQEQRFRLGFAVCLDCGDVLAKKVVRTVVPMHKSNYVMVTNAEDLIGVNQKGGLVR